MNNLEAAIQYAIAESTSALNELWSEVKTGLARLDAAAEALNPQLRLDSSLPCAGGQGNATAQVAQLFIQLVNRRNQEIHELFIKQHKYLSTFNIVLFGRTGAGKSSLIEAFACGSGTTVSQGESDWTTQVRPLRWNSCVLYDTPGIGGWGRTMSRADLEKCARNAVEIADVVLVCFDSQNQQAGEFEKVADWVEHYGKPVIAVFNQRNPRWRMPLSVNSMIARRNISQAVMQHTGNIRDEMSKIGLIGVPIVALSSKRALFGRAVEPFQGPDSTTFSKHRNQYGAKQLEAWSNFPALEALLVEALCQDATGLRLGMLRQKTCGVLRDLIDDLSCLQQEADKASEISESFIGAMLRVVGYPDRENSAARAAFQDGDVNLLTKLEQLRGNQFQSPIKGEFQEYTDRLLTAKLGALRAKSLATAEELVISAFDQKQALSAEDFKGKLFNELSIQEATQSIAKETVSFLERKAKLLIRDAQIDFDFTISEVSDVNGAAGTNWKWAEYASQAGNLLSGAAAALGGAAVMNWWNPFGWSAGVAAAVSVVGSLVAWAFDWFADKARKRAEKERQHSRRQALSQARQNVHDTYDRLIKEITTRLQQISQEVVGQLLLASLREAVALRSLQKETKAVVIYLSSLSESIPQRTPAQFLLCQATATVQQKRFPKERGAGRLLWLGEDWITDPDGLRIEENDRANLEENPTQNSYTQSFNGLHSIFSHIGSSVRPGSGAAWLNEALNLLVDHEESHSLLKELEVLLNKGKPRLYLCGDYSTGKTSFIKRLLADAGQAIPENLQVKAEPTTNEIYEYEWEGILLVDSPGFQGSRTKDAAITLQSFPDASAILYLFQPNLLVGDTTAIDLILKGDEKQGILPKQERTVFIINRADELGIDPTDSPDEYNNLCQSKKEELVLALKSRGIYTNTDYMLCLASDPYGLVGDRNDVCPSDFDPYRCWDGFYTFDDAFRASCRQFQTAGLDLSILEGGIFRLKSLISATVQIETELQYKIDWNNRINELIQEALDESVIIGNSIRAELEQIVEDHAYGLLEDTLSASNEAEADLHAKKLSRWWEEEAFKYDLERWQTKAVKNIEAWYLKTQETLERRIASVQFQYAFPEIIQQFNYRQKADRSKSSLRKLLSAVEQPLKGANRDAVYKIFKFFGYNFKPFGAIKMAKRFVKAGAAIAIVGLAFDTASFIKNIWEDSRLDESKKEALKFIRETKSQVCQSVLEGQDNIKGPIGYLIEQQNELNKLVKDLVTECQEIECQKNFQAVKRFKYEHLQRKAFHLLGRIH